MLMTLSLPTAGCLSPQSGETTTDVMLGSDTGMTVAGSTSGDSSTQPAIMTTTDEPETTDAPDTASTGTTSTTDPPDTTMDGGSCGNGSIEAGEECDEGEANANEGTCTKSCKSATCGDGYLQLGAGEVCDDGDNDGSYGGCASDCKSLGPHCGDGVVTDMVEACDGGDPWNVASGCLPNCEYAQSCKQIRESFPDDDTVIDDVYLIKRANNAPFPVYCDMDADGGGYTFLKVALPEGQTMTAGFAEQQCAEFGMKLLALRTPMHVVAAGLAAKSAMLEPIGGGTTKGTVEYLSIL
ncbi:MAG TPA: fibrinogen-like YCDxxxxGGGW domain-containing protein, partial [Nannocystis sp.]